MSPTLVITGGSKGLGWAIAEKYLQNGWCVVSGSRSIRTTIQADFLERFKQVEMDVRDRAAHKALVEEAIAWTGSVDCFINNAGFSEWRPIAEIDEEFLSSIIETNLMGYFWGSQAAASILKPGSSLINVSSLAARRGTPNNSAYVASKFGVAGLTQSLAKELGPKGIRVNAVCPVLVRTEGLLEALNDKNSPATGKPDKFLDNFATSQTALGTLPTASQVADMCFFLSSAQASAITGQSINVDCGVLPN
jgi:3-oxoacyl-[acyl-carrier protein] reductase/meso-butanediol dehydrogenase/(S,S)-butanediol dehydrogenase/diacetyl reductase